MESTTLIVLISISLLNLFALVIVFRLISKIKGDIKKSGDVTAKEILDKIPKIFSSELKKIDFQQDINPVKPENEKKKEIVKEETIKPLKLEKYTFQDSLEHGSEIKKGYRTWR